MGFVTTSKPLTENHAFFQTSSQEAHADIRPRVAHVGSGKEEYEQNEDGYSDHDDDDFVPLLRTLMTRIQKRRTKMRMISRMSRRIEKKTRSRSWCEEPHKGCGSMAYPD